MGLLLRFTLGFDDLAERPCFGIDEAGELEHWVLDRIDGGSAPFVKLFAKGDIFEFGAVDQFGGAFAGGFARQNLLY